MSSNDIEVVPVSSIAVDTKANDISSIVQFKNHLGLAMANAQREIVPPKKSREVDFTYNGQRTHYHYADLADVLESLREPFSKNGLALFHKMGITNGKFGLTTYLVHSSGQSIDTWYPLPDPQSMKPQAFGSALTYARRYSVSSLVGIASEDDDDGQMAAQNPPTIPDTKPAQKAQSQAKPAVQHNNSKPKESKTAAPPGDYVLPIDGPDKLKGQKLADIPINKVESLLASLKAEMDKKPRVEHFNSYAQIAGRVRAYLKTVPKTDLKGEGEVQSFPPDDVPVIPAEPPIERKQSVNNDPGKYVIPIDVLDIGGQSLDKLPEDTLKNIANWLDKVMKTAPPPPNLPQIFEANQRVRAFLKEVGVNI